MRVAEEAGMIKKLGLLVRPITRRLFPSIPEDHPAIGAMIMNISANMLGLSNAATPLGLKAMDELQKLNKENKLRLYLTPKAKQLLDKINKNSTFS